MGLELTHIDGQTPLDEDEKEGLLIPTIATRSELDEFEQQNIEQAILWTLNRSYKSEVVFTEGFIQELHKRMYGEVWAWAGELRKLLDDARYWFANNTYTPDEFTIRYKHRLVNIHCFPNGNGRHSRLMADLIISKLYKLPVYSWGAANLIKHSDIRSSYLGAIKAADNGDLKPLINFARS